VLHLECSQYYLVRLVECGANPDIRNKKGKKPLQLISKDPAFRDIRLSLGSNEDLLFLVRTAIVLSAIAITIFAVYKKP